ncbi:WD repeat-containing protein on Y chromosome [Topomyia yanbarensis]|uniref:WD repeat-containing protein on Y chromosome n=1 Tax=Topomyia yanbarensis TaxID=2498891 RepID=UPI00273BF15F|nr:WD repeat-containing protein on Y chromosome [Topomyia yanbarensis]
MDFSAVALSTSVKDYSNPQLLHRHLSQEDIEYLREVFIERKQLLPEELRSELHNLTGVQFKDEDFEALFMKINTDQDNFCQWDELISYLILGFQNDDPLAVQESLDLPISSDLGLKLGRQTYPVTKIEYSPFVSYEGTVNWSQGSWITSTREAVINFWKRDWKHEKTGKAFSVDLKRAKTMILDTAVLPDQYNFCVACLECELRFYDIIASGFTLKTIVNRIPHAINALFYHFAPNSRSKLILGDFIGFVRIIEFYPEKKEPFKFDAGSAITRMSFRDLMSGHCPQMLCIDYGRLLPDVVQQVMFVEATNCVLACSENNPLVPHNQRNKLQKSLVIQHWVNHDKRTEFKVPKGVACFAFEHLKDLLVTGGPDGQLRLWDSRRPEKPTVVLPGHNAGVVFLFLQDEALKIYSMDQKKIVKIWDMLNRVLIQTYSGFATNLYKTVPACALYSEASRELLVGANKVLSATCCPKIPLEVTDGESHTQPISVLLYNPLFKVVISCGLDSFIIVWDHTVNRKLTVITNAHTQIVNGLQEKVQITTACFDPKLQLLLTGARDGTMKIWNFNSGSLMSSMSIEPDCEVTAVFWEPTSILAMGWNCVVCEFPVGQSGMDFPSNVEWQKLHSDDILGAAVTHSEPRAVATCSYTGELIFWMLQTGQPYRRFDAAKPTIKIPVNFRRQIKPHPPRRTTRTSIFLPQEHWKHRRLTKIEMPVTVEQLRQLTINTMLFLEKRLMHPEYGTLMASLDTGIIQVYSHHPDGGFLGSFRTSHMAGDRVVTMTTDAQNRFLFTGSYLGYVKIWLIENYFIPEAKQSKINRAALRLQFSFLHEDVIPGRAKRSVTHQADPWLLNSYQAHRNCITALVYMESTKVLVSASSDRTIRMWSLNGQYIGLLGSPVKWAALNPDVPIPTGYQFRIPPDLQREVSFTTAQVLRGGERVIKFKSRILQEASERRRTEAIETYGKPLEDPILNPNVFPYMERSGYVPDPKMDYSFQVAPIFEHLSIQNLLKLKPVDSENAIRRVKELDFSQDGDRIDSYNEKDQQVSQFSFKPE